MKLSKTTKLRVHMPQDIIGTIYLICM